jgi:hypothetical protein
MKMFLMKARAPNESQWSQKHLRNHQSFARKKLFCHSPKLPTRVSTDIDGSSAAYANSLFYLLYINVSKSFVITPRETERQGNENCLLITQTAAQAQVGTNNRKNKCGIRKLSASSTEENESEN